VHPLLPGDTPHREEVRHALTYTYTHRPRRAGDPRGRRRGIRAGDTAHPGPRGRTEPPGQPRADLRADANRDGLVDLTGATDTAGEDRRARSAHAAQRCHTSMTGTRTTSSTARCTAARTPCATCRQPGGAARSPAGPATGLSREPVPLSRGGPVRWDALHCERDLTPDAGTTTAGTTTRNGPHRDHDEGRSLVREGGVEPPRPFGHWNLNPARLPIPPPAHWVCPRVLLPAVLGPSDIEKISTLEVVGSHPFPSASPPPPEGGPPAKVPAPGRVPTEPDRLPLRINVCRFTYQPRTGPAHLLRRRARCTVRCGTLVWRRLYDLSTARGVRRGASQGTSSGVDTRRPG